MKRTLMKNAIRFSFNQIHGSQVAPVSILNRSRLGYFTSESDSSGGSRRTEMQNARSVLDDVEDVSTDELKRRIEKLKEGDMEAIPSIFEAILTRKLLGKHEESDDELMKEYDQPIPDDIAKQVGLSSDGEDEEDRDL